MSEQADPQNAAGRWADGTLPERVKLGAGTLVSGAFAFKRFYARQDGALQIGSGSTMDGVQFALGPNGRMSIGDCCYFSSVVLLCELEVRIGNHVMIGWNTTIADTDFHPIDPAERIKDAEACSPLGKGRPRPAVECRPVVIEDDVYIGPSVTILKGVTIGAGSWIEPGSVITVSIPAGSRVIGNPGRVVGPATESGQ